MTCGLYTEQGYGSGMYMKQARHLNLLLPQSEESGACQT